MKQVTFKAFLYLFVLTGFFTVPSGLKCFEVAEAAEGFGGELDGLGGDIGEILEPQGEVVFDGTPGGGDASSETSAGENAAQQTETQADQAEVAQDAATEQLTDTPEIEAGSAAHDPAGNPGVAEGETPSQTGEGLGSTDTAAGTEDTPAQADAQAAKEAQNLPENVQTEITEVQAADAGKEGETFNDKLKEYTDAQENLKSATEKARDIGKEKEGYAEAQEELGQAQERFNEAERSYNEAKAKENLENTKKSLESKREAATTKVDEAKSKISKDVTGESVEDIEGSLKEKYGDVESAQEYEDSLRDKEPSMSEEDIQAKVDEYTKDMEALDELKSAQSELEDLNRQVEQINRDIAAGEESWGQWAKGKLKGFFHWLFEQLSMGFAFMIPGQLVNAIKQAQAEKALYETITKDQTFGTIKMKIISGLVPRHNPSAGVFIYVDEPGPYTAMNRRFFASYGKYGDIAKEYLGSGVVRMVELKTGAVIDGSGVIDDTMPLFKNVTAPSRNSNDHAIQTELEKQYRFVAGQIKTEKFGDLFSAEPNFFSTHDASPKGNPTVAKLFDPSKNDLYAPPSSQTGISPLLKNSLSVFSNNTFLPAFGIGLQEMEGIGALTYALTNYSDLFFSSSKDFSLGKSIIKSINSGADISSKEAMAKITGKEVVNVGVPIGTKLVGQGIYLYQSDTTFAARFMRKRVDNALQKYVHDYLVCINEEKDIVPALIPKVNSNINGPIDKPVVEWAPNPNITYIVSLVTGATFAPGSMGHSLKKDDGSQDYSIANDVVDKVVNQYSSALHNGKSAEIKTQLGTMKYLAEMFISEGPFHLREGVVAHLVKDLNTKLSSVGENALQKVQALNLLGKAGQGEKLSDQDSGLAIQEKEKMLGVGGGVYVYRIDDVLPGGPGGAKLPDYVIPVTVNQSTGNYLIVPLGMQAAVQSGVALPTVSAEVTALISLITGKIYDATYTLIPKAFKTNILDSQSPGVPYKCPDSTSAGVVCAGGYKVQPGGKNVPLATAFMETDLNPINKDKSSDNEIKMWPFYFLFLKYDYTDAAVKGSGGKKEDIGKFLAAKFMNVNSSAGAKTTQVSLYRVLPQTFTGIPWPSTVNAYLAEEQKEAQNLSNQADASNTSSLQNPSSTSSSGSQNQSDAQTEEDGQHLERILSGLHTMTVSTQEQNPADMSFVQIHSLWRANLMSDPAHKWSITLAEGPHEFTNNGANDWSLSAEQQALLSGVFLYRVSSPNSSTPLKGLWVAAQLGQTGGSIKVNGQQITDQLSLVTGPQFRGIGMRFGLSNENSSGNGPDVFSIARPSDSFSLSSLSNIGGDFSENGSLNALINIGTGAVLVKVAKQNNDKSILDIVVPVANSMGGLFQFNPSDVLAALQKTSGGKLSDGISAQIDVLQSGRTTDKYGPFAFGPFVSFINRQQVNNGNYIYQVYTGSSMDESTVNDYLVAVRPNPQGGLIWGGQIDMGTPYVVSLVSGIKYSRTNAEDALWKYEGQKHIIQYSDILPKKSGDVSLLGFPQKIFSIMSSVSGVSIDQNLQNKIVLANKDYVSGLLKKKDEQQGTADMGYPEKVAKLLNDGKTKFTFPDVGSLKQVEKVTSGDSTNLYQDSAGNFYLRESELMVKAKELSNNKMVGYYVFNVATPGDDELSIVPTGVYFEVDTGSGKATAVSVIYGHTASSMAAAHGITISESTGQQSKTFPVERQALAMTQGDKSLAGGQDGTIMKLVQPGAVAVSKDGKSKIFLYKNISNFHALSDATRTVTLNGVETKQLITPIAPSDILLQMNPAQKDPFYISLITGLEYTIDGQPMHQTAAAYFPEKQDRTPITAAPLVVWGEGEKVHLYMPSNFEGDVKDIRFDEYTVVSGGVTYQYATSGSGESQIYNFTYLNPQTGEADGGVYKVATKTGKVIKSWKPSTQNNSVTGSPDPLSVQASSNMQIALDEAKKEGLVPSQEIYSMVNSGFVNAGPAQINAYYSIAANSWALYRQSDFQKKEPLGIFKRFINKDRTPIMVPTVLKFLGKRGSDSLNTLLEAMNSPTDNLVVGRSVVFRDNYASSTTRGSISGFTWIGRYFALDDASKHNWYTNGGIGLSLSQTISPMLYCAGTDSSKSSANSSNSSSDSCTKWPYETGQQLPNDVNYYAIVDGQMKTPTSFVYGFEFPVAGQRDLNKYYQTLKLRPVVSNKGIITMVKNLDVANLTQLTTQNIGVTGKTGNESYDDYKNRVIQKLKDFYTNKTETINAQAAQTARAIDQNAKTQESFAKKGDVPAVAQIEGPVQMPGSQEAADGAKAAINREKLRQIEQLNQEQKQNEAKLTALFATLEARIGRLYYDGNTQYLLYKISADDSIAEASSGYVSYPYGTDAGGFIFDTNGIPTGDVVSVSQVTGIQEKMGNLTVSSTNPLKLAPPKIIGNVSVQIPNFVPLTQQEQRQQSSTTSVSPSSSNATGVQVPTKTQPQLSSGA